MSSQAYTPGLKVKERYIVRKIRKLPIQGDVLVQKGEKVTHESIVARTFVPGPLHIVNVCTELSIEPEDIEKHMKIKIGDEIKVGEPIAHYQAFFGLIKATCYSPIDATLELTSSVTGQAMLREKPVQINLGAYMPGVVEEVLPYEGVVIVTLASYIQGIIGIGGENHGIIKILASTPEDVINPNDINDECKSKLVVCGSLITFDCVKKAIEVGVTGLIAGGIRGTDLNAILGEELGVIITGQENLGLTLIITEGFGRMNMQKKTFDLLKVNEGRLACFNGATQVRAGVVRPEIVIPLPEKESTNVSIVEGEDQTVEGLSVGTLVRLIQDPNFGAIGNVIELPIELYTLGSESEVRVLKVKLKEGQEVVVPRANVEIIEE